MRIYIYIFIKIHVSIQNISSVRATYVYLTYVRWTLAVSPIACY